MNTIIYLGALSLLLGTSYGLKCYECDGADHFFNNGDCGDTYEPASDQLKMCNASAGEVWCRKEKTGINNAFTHIERGCVAQCEERNDGYIRRVTCCQNEDGCNSAVEMVLSLPLAIASIVLTALLAKFKY